MELATALSSKTVRADIRTIGINPNHWYAIAWAKDLKPSQVIPVTIWNQPHNDSIGRIAVYRDTHNQLHALEDICPHRGVALHKGKVIGANLACRYHGWQFDGSGQCVTIPYLPAHQPLPCAHARSYPIQEQHGLIWIFPGQPELSTTVHLPDVPELNELGWLVVPVTVDFQAHFSICNENTMDVFHGVLHEDLQGWFNPVLLTLKETEASVRAEYQVSYKGWLARFLGLSETATQVTTVPVMVEYRYPHYRSHMPGVSALYLMRLPISPTESRSFSLFFFKVRLPVWLLKLIQPVLQSVLNRLVLMKFIAQDQEMVESEQQTHLRIPGHRYVEINPAIIAVQRLMIKQYEQFVRESGAHQPNGHKPESVSVS